MAIRGRPISNRSPPISLLDLPPSPPISTPISIPISTPISPDLPPISQVLVDGRSHYREGVGGPLQPEHPLTPCFVSLVHRERRRKRARLRYPLWMQVGDLLRFL